MHVEDTPIKPITIMRETKVKMYFLARYLCRAIRTKRSNRRNLFLVLLFSMCDHIHQVLVIKVPRYIRWECRKHLFHLWKCKKENRNVWVQTSQMKLKKTVTVSAVARWPPRGRTCPLGSSTSPSRWEEKWSSWKWKIRSAYAKCT